MVYSVSTLGFIMWKCPHTIDGPGSDIGLGMVSLQVVSNYTTVQRFTEYLYVHLTK